MGANDKSEATFYPTYTPTDDEMREHIAWMAPDGMEALHVDAFDRWLAAHDERVRSGREA